MNVGEGCGLYPEKFSDRRFSCNCRFLGSNNNLPNWTLFLTQLLEFCWWYCVAVFTNEHGIIFPQGDVDLRHCRPDLQMRCSYFKVYYGDDAKFLNYKITKEYCNHPQKFVAKVAIVQVGPIDWHFFAAHSTSTAHVLSPRLLIDFSSLQQTWDQVGYYDRRTDKGNTFQVSMAFIITWGK